MSSIRKYLVQIPLRCNAMKALSACSKMLAFWELHLQKQRDAGSKEER